MADGATSCDLPDGRPTDRRAHASPSTWPARTAACRFDELAPRTSRSTRRTGLPGLQRARHPLRGRPRAGRARPGPVPRRRRHRALGRGHAASTSGGCSRRSPTRSASRPRTPWQKLQPRRRRRSCTARPAGPRPVQATGTAGPAPTTPTTRAWCRNRAAPRRGRVRLRPRASRATCARCPARRAGAPGSSRRPGGHGGRPPSSSSATCRSASGQAAARAGAVRAGQHDRRAGAQGGQRPARFLLDVGLDYLTLDRARPPWPAARRSASGWPPRSAAAWSACSTCSTSRPSGCTSGTTTG